MNRISRLNIRSADFSRNTKMVVPSRVPSVSRMSSQRIISSTLTEDEHGIHRSKMSTIRWFPACAIHWNIEEPLLYNKNLSGTGTQEPLSQETISLEQER